MKKTYINPTLMVVEIKPTNLLQTLSMVGKDAKTSAMARRGRFSRWEEDDFEE